MNDCNGHGSCVEAKCICDKNYVSADCSIQLEKLQSTFELPPRDWRHFKGDKGVIYEISKTLEKNDNPVEMYT